MNIYFQVIFSPSSTLIQIYSLGYCLLTSLSAIQIYYACRTGQDLEDVRSEAKTILEEFATRTCTDHSDGVKFRAKVLVERMGKPGALKPLSYFSVNNSAHLSGISTMITYLIVLMQFKVSGEPAEVADEK